MSKVYEYHKERGEICRKCDDIIPEWSFICPVCFCQETEENKGEEMKGRYKVFLRNTGNHNALGRNMIKLPQKIWKEMGWKINENLQIDMIKSGMHQSIHITKEEK